MANNSKGILQDVDSEKMFADNTQHIGDYAADASKGYLCMKRIQDIVFSALAMILLSPVLLIIALAVWLEDLSSNPIFSQWRVGKGGKQFKLYKFRTMHPNAESSLIHLLNCNEMNGPVFKIKDDPRITRIGGILRKTGLDELPQLWNICKGEMSLVGPRPALIHEVAQYDQTALQRLSVKPGLTCYWQIQPFRNNILFEDWMQLDMQYIKQRSFGIDWKIILKTIRTLFSKYGV